MAASRPRITVTGVDLGERAVRMRLPFRFGVVTLTHTQQAFVRIRIRDAAGRVGLGQAAELMVPKWFDKSASLSNEDNVDQLRKSLGIAREAILSAGSGTPFGLHAAIEKSVHATANKLGLPGLVASFGLALIDRAIIDAVARLNGATVVDLVRSNALGIDAATTPDLAGFDLDGFLGNLAPVTRIRARHTVGLIDPLTEAEIPAAERLDDGLPQSLEDIAARYGHTSFKLKVSGNPDADIDRLTRIAAVIDKATPSYEASLDGNEQFADAASFAAFWDRLVATPALARLKASILFVEQPINRATALAGPVTAIAKSIPVEIDESDAEPDSFLTARALGYAGVSSKSCKGFYRALLNRARVAKWSAEDPATPWFMSAEDLTTQSGLAVQQDLVLASLIGMTHVERNGHHYVDGMAGAPDSEQSAFLSAHPDLYAASSGRTRLAIKGGELALGSSLGAHALGSAVTLDWAATTPLTYKLV